MAAQVADKNPIQQLLEKVDHARETLLAPFDFLTGASNRRAAEEMASQEYDPMSLKLPYKAKATRTGKSMGVYTTVAQKAPLEWAQPVDHEHLYDDVDQLMHTPLHLAHNSRRRQDFHNHQLGRGAVVAANMALFAAIFFLTPHF